MIATIVYLVGNYWQEEETRKKVDHMSFLSRIANKRYADTMERCMCGAAVIITVSKYLEKVVQERFPDRPVCALYSGTDPSAWHPEKGMTLKHPCVGLVQKATVWDKAKEMLILKQVMDRFPNVTFYWVGYGAYVNKILEELQGYSNFQYLGKLAYPDGVRQFLTEVDIYALLTGLDALPSSLREASLMKKPVIATNIGGVPEMLEDGRTGFLVERGDGTIIAEKISQLLVDKEMLRQMGTYGREFIMNNFSPDATATKFMYILEAMRNPSISLG